MAEGLHLLFEEGKVRLCYYALVRKVRSSGLLGLETLSGYEWYDVRVC